jgi:hypothetical protein
MRTSAMRRGISRLAAASCLLAGVLGCGPAGPTGAPGSGAAAAPATEPATLAPSPTQDRAAGWRSDLEQLLPAMAAIHPNLEHSTPRADLDAAAADLAATIEEATDDQLMVGVLRVVAMVSAAGCDAHTGAFIWGTGSYPVDSMPLRLWLFGDEVVIVDALAPYEALVGARLDSVEGQPIDEVLDTLAPLIPRDNLQSVRLLTPRYLLIPQVLRGLGLADAGAVTLEVADDAGTTQSVDVKPIPMADYNGWAGPYGLHLPVDPNVEYLARIGDALWWTRLPDVETLFVQYNRVDRMSPGTLGDLRTELHKPDVARVILDLRHNYGGELSALDPILAMFDDPAVDQPDRLYVITGRNTFSAASLLVAWLDRDTEAVFVGEAMAGCPTAYGDSSDVTLAYSGIVVSVAGILNVGASADDKRQTIEPDVLAELTRTAWEDGRDLAREAIVTIGP